MDRRESRGLSADGKARQAKWLDLVLRTSPAEDGKQNYAGPPPRLSCFSGLNYYIIIAGYWRTNQEDDGPRPALEAPQALGLIWAANMGCCLSTLACRV